MVYTSQEFANYFSKTHELNVSHFVLGIRTRDIHHNSDGSAVVIPYVIIISKEDEWVDYYRRKWEEEDKKWEILLNSDEVEKLSYETSPDVAFYTLLIL